MEYALEEYEKKCEEIRRHLNNADFFINGYLLLYEPLIMEEGLSSVWGFLDDYYLRKCAGTEGTRKEMAASIKKFYRCMKEHGKISGTSFEILCDDIKEIISQPMRESY